MSVATIERAFATFEIKAVHEDERIIEGVASTPSTDRMGDIVEPMGAEFKLPLPLLWQHRHDQPVGSVVWAKPTSDGIPFRAKVESDDQPGPLKDLLDLAWRSVKKGLVRGVSIGFATLESTEIEGTWGRRFVKWDWLELSLVTIPANVEATIQSVKSFATEPATSGDPVPTPPPAVAGIPYHQPRSGRNTVTQTLNAVEAIKSLEASRAAKSARMTEIQAAASAAGITKDAAQQEEFDTLHDEIKGLDRELADLRALEAIAATKAAPVTPAPVGVTQSDHASEVRSGAAAIALPKKYAPGIQFARVARAIGLAARANRDVELVARELYPDEPLLVKTAVAAGTTTHSTWAKPLVGETSQVFADFAEFLRPTTILGKFGVGGTPSLRTVPFRTRLLSQTSGGNGYWVGEGKAKGLTKFDFAGTSLDPLKVANIAVIAEELLGSSSPSADALVRDGLAAALRERMDVDFINPSKAAVPGVSPASITRSVVPVTSSGNSADDIRADLRALFGQFIAADNPPTAGVVVMPATVALALSMMRNPLGQAEFPGITMAGGTFEGLPVIVSEYVPTDSTGAIVVLLNASDIYFADEGDITIDVSREASLQMDTEPSHDSVTPTAAQLVSLWQTNSVGFRAERTLNWAKRRTSAVQVLDQVNWGQPES